MLPNYEHLKKVYNQQCVQSTAGYFFQNWKLFRFFHFFSRVNGTCSLSSWTFYGKLNYFPKLRVTFHSGHNLGCPKDVDTSSPRNIRCMNQSLKKNSKGGLFGNKKVSKRQKSQPLYFLVTCHTLKFCFLFNNNSI